MDYLTNYYKNLSEQLQNKVDRLSSQLKLLHESANPDPGDLQSPWESPYSDPYSPSQPYWEYPEPQPTRRPGRGIIPSIDDVYPPESPTKRQGRPIPELGVLQSDAGAEEEKSVEQWMLDMLPKEIKELMKEWNRTAGHPTVMQHFWEAWQEWWLWRRGQWENSREDKYEMLKEFQKVWKIFQEEWFRAAPGNRPTMEDLIRKYFKIKNRDPDEKLPLLA